MFRKLSVFVLTAATMVVALAGTAAACGFLIAPNGAVRLVRTTTFVAWDGEVERYITNFEFQSDQESFGSIIPLPGEPTHVGKAGGWTLQRLDREVRPPQPFEAADGDSATAAGGRSVEVILETKVDSLDITVVKGGGAEVAAWAADNGFDLGGATDADVAGLLDYYGDRSPYFMAAKFDADRAAGDGFTSGDGIPVLIEVPVERPWVPIHILGFDLPNDAPVIADVFLLTPDRPELLHGEGLAVNRSEAASQLLLDDLRSDENMEWVPTDGWFTHLELDGTAGDLTYDLSIGADGIAPSPYEAGLTRFDLDPAALESFGLELAGDDVPWVALVAVSLVAGALAGVAGAWLLRSRATDGVESGLATLATSDGTDLPARPPTRR